MIQSITIIILLLLAFNNYGMESNNQEITQEEIIPKTHEIKEEQDSYCTICQTINEEIKTDFQINKENIWNQIKEFGIKIEKKEKYLKILFPEINEITKIKGEIFINFEMDESEEEKKIVLDNIFTPFKNKEFIKNGTNLPSIKNTIFINYKGKIDYSFCIIPQKDINNIKIYFTCKDLETKIYATFPEENKNGDDSNSIPNEEIKEENENIEEKNEN